MGNIRKQRLIIDMINIGDSVADGDYRFYGGAGITQPFCQMSVGYKEAADLLVASDNCEDYLVYPICFLYRHAIELKLKSIFFYFTLPINEAFSEDDIKKRCDDLKNNHNLNKLWESDLGLLKDRIIQFGVSDNLIQEITNGINQIQEFDPTSFEMRYPGTKERDDDYSIMMNPTHERTHGINIISLRKGIDDLWSNLNEFSHAMDDLFSRFLEHNGDKT